MITIQRKRYWFMAFLVIGVLCLSIPAAFASSVSGSAGSVSTIDKEELEGLPSNRSIDVSLLPFQYAAVSGDYEKFQAHQWIPAGYTGGLNLLTFEQENEEKGITGEVHARSLIGPSDFAGEVRIDKEGLGYILFEFEQFRKYFSDRGQVYHPLGSSPVSGADLDRELMLDIGKFGVEIGYTPEDAPHLIMKYEREYKDGEKSSLALAESTISQGGSAWKIAPAWREIDERVDVYEISLEDQLGGFNLSLDQRIEVINIMTTRYENNLAENTSAPIDYKRRYQVLEPDMEVYQTTFKADRWLLDDKAHTSLAYLFSHTDSRESDNYFEGNIGNAPTNFSRPHQVRGAEAVNNVSLHRLVLDFTAMPTSALQAAAKILFETRDRDSTSDYTHDDAGGGAAPATDPDGIIDHIEITFANERSQRIAESFSVRFKGIPKTALYSKLDLSQESQHLSEARSSGGLMPSTGEVWQRDTDIQINRGQFTIGANVSPVRMVNVSSQFSYKRDNHDYDNDRESVQGATAHYDSLDIQKASVSTRVRVRPCNFLTGTFRHTASDVDIFTRTQYDSTFVETGNIQNNYVFDLMLQPLPELNLGMSFTRATNATEVQGAVFGLPTFNADHNTWAFNANFVPTEAVSFNSTFFWTRADNFIDYSDYGVPFGSDFNRVGLTADLNIEVKEDVSVKPYYAFYQYQASSLAELGNYNAHIIGMEVNAAWG